MRRRKNYGVILFLIMISISLGYALIQTDLTINGISKIAATSWNVYFDNVQVTTGSVELSSGDSAPVIDPTTLTSVSFTVTLKEPGDFYEFTVDVKNTGTLDAMIDTISNKLNNVEITNLPAYMSYSVTYSDSIPLAQYHLLAHNTTQTYKVRVGYRTDIDPDDLPDEITTNVITFGVTYVQKTNSAINKPTRSFANDSWEMIINAVRTGDTSYYHVGDTKSIELGNSLGTHTLRIANTTTPAECSTTGFSQTACGFVLEFADIVTGLHINDAYHTTYGGSVGGWPATLIRTYLNDMNDSTSVINSIPEVLRNAIIDTTVVSGHGNTTGETNFISTDKLYLLAVHEVFEDVDGNTSSGIDYYDTAYNNTRQLDYYSGINVTSSSYSGAIKRSNSNNSWWLRSPLSNYPHSFRTVGSNGSCGTVVAHTTLGVSPAFRLES